VFAGGDIEATERTRQRAKQLDQLLGDLVRHVLLQPCGLLGGGVARAGTPARVARVESAQNAAEQRGELLGANAGGQDVFGARQLDPTAQLEPDLRALGGLYRSQPAVACLAMVPLFSLAGIPPLSGFIAKLAVVGAVLAGNHYWLAGVALVVSLLTVLSMARLWDEAIWKPSPTDASLPRLGVAIVAPIAWLVALTLGFTVAAGPAYGVSMRAAAQLLDARGYIHAVLGEDAPRAAR